ncbi:MAG: hypothetical protein IJJ06_06745 [Mogibacterium sp.]|nr:hypothetical protein [Mogibacterium sp.]
MVDQAQVLRIIRKLEEIRRIRPDVYELIVKSLDLPEEDQAEFLANAMPMVRHNMN